jgi:prepilin peptidase CpaA
MMGAGDIKLLMAAGGLLGWPGSLRLFVLSILFGTLVSAIVFAGRVRFSDRFRYFRAYVRKALLTGEVYRYRMEGERPENIHFALPVFLAAVAETALELTALYGLVGMMG